ncbi:RING-type domain-containing protein [Mycena indigotica]|uniref:RING-type domain-containing protein n=1 Tax=Mycena indigotica TaxID=2126181 RepID=A0A8H6SWP8_9AGAR|nr:RING-type domain-containing protein [Mycena indigotica]KAF7306754.1 RING-type domain-containing protein [Mycena indigotica]
MPPLLSTLPLIVMFVWKATPNQNHTQSPAVIYSASIVFIMWSLQTARFAVDHSYESEQSDFTLNVLNQILLNVERQELADEVDLWLNGQSEDNHAPLRKARSAFSAYNRLLHRKHQDRETIRDYQARLRRKDDENRQATVDNSELTAKVSRLSQEITQLQSQIEPLRSELAKYERPTHNPLPAPPQPVDFNRYPAFARGAAESAEGFAASYLSTNRANLFPTKSSSSKRKGKARQIDTPPPSPPEPFSPGQQLQFGRSANVIIPGASPSQRVIPSPDIIPNHAYVTPLPASAYVNGYSTGYNQGYSAANTNSTFMPNYHTSSSVHQLPNHFSEPDELDVAMGGLQLQGVPAASAAIAPSRRPAPESAPASRSTTRSARRQAQPSLNSERSVEVASSRPSAPRRTTVQVDNQLHSTQQPHIYAQPPIYAPPPEPVATLPAALPTAWQQLQHRHNPNRQSYSSWGTIDSNASNSPARTSNSLSDLGSLRNFPYGVRTTEDILDRGLVSTPGADDTYPLGFTGPTPQPRRAPSSLMNPTYHYSTTLETLPRSFSQQPEEEFGLMSAPNSMDNALGLELGLEPQEYTINAPTPRVQMGPFVNSWDLNNTH